MGLFYECDAGGTNLLMVLRKNASENRTVLTPATRLAQLELSKKTREKSYSATHTS